MGNPTVLLLDEPSEGLAPIVVRQIASVLHQLRKSGSLCRRDGVSGRDCAVEILMLTAIRRPVSEAKAEYYDRSSEHCSALSTRG
jgi:ABC-type polar amino acid transport system ATPase subunit